MSVLLQLFIILPVLGFIISLLIPKKYESFISWTAFTTVLLQLAGLVVFIIAWLADGAADLNLKEFTLIRTANYEFFIDFYFDRVAAVYLFIGALLTFMVTTYSRYYLHRESGYKRFFNTI